MLEILKLSFVLTIIAVCAGLAVALTNQATSDRIAEQKQRRRDLALAAVMPPGAAVEEIDGNEPVPVRYWIGRRDGEIVAYAFQDKGKGYAGDIRFMAGIAPDGTILGMTILSHAETPGLGDRVEESVSKKYLWNGLFGEKEQVWPWFTKQFEGLNVLDQIDIVKTAEWHKLSVEKREELERKNQVTAITGATISTRAVTSAMTRSIPEYLVRLEGLTEDK